LIEHSKSVVNSHLIGKQIKAPFVVEQQQGLRRDPHSVHPLNLPQSCEPHQTTIHPLVSSNNISHSTEHSMR
jgi:hypothetical protein